MNLIPPNDRQPLFFQKNTVGGVESFPNGFDRIVVPAQLITAIDMVVRRLVAAIRLECVCAVRAIRLLPAIALLKAVGVEMIGLDVVFAVIRPQAVGTIALRDLCHGGAIGLGLNELLILQGAVPVQIFDV